MLPLINTDSLNDLDKVSIKYTHGDYNVLQFIYLNRKINAILDFVSACDMPIVWEIIRSYSYIDRKCINGVFDIDNLISYTKEYQKCSYLSKYDLKYMSYVYLI